MSSEPFTPFSTASEPLECEASSVVGFFEPEAGFLAGAALPRDAAGRVGAALSLLELELCELERGFSPSAEASDRLERSVRFSAGIFEAIGQLLLGVRESS